MKNLIGKDLWNVFPLNKTQTQYFRFLNTPTGKIKTMFTDSQERFDKNLKDIFSFKTRYSKFMEK